MKEQIIQLDRSDDFHSARDKIGWTQADRVLLVWPTTQRGHPVPVLHRKLDLVLLERHAAGLGARLGLVTSNEELVDLAKEFGLPSFNSVRDSHLFRWRKTRNSKASAVRHRPKTSLHKTEDAPLIQFRAPAWLSNPFVSIVFRLSYFGITLFAIVSMLALVVPSARISLAPNIQHIDALLEINADPEFTVVDPNNFAIPAYTTQIDISGFIQIPVTGTTDQAIQRAQGTVTFTNLTDQAFRVPAGTAVRTTGSVPTRYVTQQDVDLAEADGSTAEAPILAVEPGPNGNVGPGLINGVEGPLRVQIAVVNLHESGGGEVSFVPAVTLTDWENAREQLEAELLLKGHAEILANLRRDEFSPDATVRLLGVTDTTYDAFPGEAAEFLNLEMHATMAASVIRDEDAFEIGRYELQSRTGESLKLLTSSVYLERGDLITAANTGQVSFYLWIRGDAGPVVEVADVQEAVRWKSPVDAAAILKTEFPVVQPPILEIRPDWFPRLPWLAWRIDVDILSDAIFGN